MKTALKYLIPFVVLFLSIPVLAQTNNIINEADMLANFGKAGRIVLKGKAKNLKDKYFEFAMTSYTYNNESYFVDFNKDGSFEKSFPIINSQQLYLYLNNDAITITVADGDTVLLNWDEKNFDHTFNLSANKVGRATTLEVEWEIYKKFRKPETELRQRLSKERETLDAKRKFDLINELYNKKVRLILSKDAPKAYKYIDYLLSNNYFMYVSWLRSAGLLEEFKLKVIEDSTFKMPMIEGNATEKSPEFAKYNIVNENYKIANELYLKDLPEYRAFMFNYLRFTSPINRLVRAAKGSSPTNFIFNDYYMAKACLQSTLIEDWFITNIIMFGFDFSQFKDVEEVYNHYLPEAKTPYFKKALEEKYALVKQLKPGVRAPNFSLTDDQGKTISLSDFNGKVVYIDFWGVNCGPCIYDIDNYEAKLHNKYKDVVFINICVDSGNKVWKNAIKEHKLTGVNLIAEGWTKNPVCKTYGINGIPHYLIINKDGSIANNNAARMNELVGIGKNELDIALEKN
ncbi:TlpA family protein disulfide reductase [Pedobacter kyungheensis]|uniref:TlpA family protein disulfide reductase n=1 Tax=Pedobacter kyungheensis TaxID=1069985 RepID=UPI00068C8B6E|nr:TlpA disulfide reductase family protein [Pedobacter kyungheensis]